VCLYDEAAEINGVLFPSVFPSVQCTEEEKPTKDDSAINSSDCQIGSQQVKNASIRDFHPKLFETKDDSFSHYSIEPLEYD
jgi:hypothetical protein